MASVKAGSVTKGMFLDFRGEPHQVTKAEFYHPGKGSAVNRLKLRNLKTGNSVDMTYKTHDSVEYIEVSSQEMQFLYADGSEVVFMDPRSFEQVNLPQEMFADTIGFLTSDAKVYVQFHDGEPLGVTLPPKVKLKVTEAFDADAGGRVNAPKKPVTLETGIEIQAPLFVKTGDVLIIDTTTGEYVSRG